MCGYSAYDWNTIAMFRSFGGTWLMTRSPILIWPPVISAARGPDEHEELSVGDQEVEVVDRDGVVRVGLGDVVERDACHARGC
jgi:hypothetical protein